MPVLVPVEQVGVLPEALREMLLSEALVYRRVRGVGLADEARQGVEVLLLPPMDRYLGLGYRGPGLLFVLAMGHPPFVRSFEADEYQDAAHHGGALSVRWCRGQLTGTCSGSSRPLWPQAARQWHGRRPAGWCWSTGPCQVKRSTRSSRRNAPATPVPRVIAVLEPSADRVAPPCPPCRPGLRGLRLAARFSGGPAPLQDRGGLGGPRAHRRPRRGRCRPSPPASLAGYRTTLRLSSDGARPGFRRHRGHEVVPVDTCLVAHPLLGELLRER